MQPHNSTVRRSRIGNLTLGVALSWTLLGCEEVREVFRYLSPVGTDVHESVTLEGQFKLDLSPQMTNSTSGEPSAPRTVSVEISKLTRTERIKFCALRPNLSMRSGRCSDFDLLIRAPKANPNAGTEIVEVSQNPRSWRSIRDNVIQRARTIAGADHYEVLGRLITLQLPRVTTAGDGSISTTSELALEVVDSMGLSLWLLRSNGENGLMLFAMKTGFPQDSPLVKELFRDHWRSVEWSPMAIGKVLACGISQRTFFILFGRRQCSTAGAPEESGTA